jgi:hypothetical protein
VIVTPPEEKKSLALFPISRSAVARCILKGDLLFEAELLWGPKNKE